jgi:glycerol-3-phosphate dehydrogenase
VLEPALADPALLEPLAPDAPDIAAQAVYAAEREWARNAEDILRRRTTLALRGLAGPELTRRVEQLVDGQLPGRETTVVFPSGSTR